MADWIKQEGKLNAHTYLVDSLLFGTPENMACYVVEGKKKRVLIDASGKSEGRKLAIKLREMHLEPDILLLTHTHWDHAGGISMLKNEKNFPKMEIMACHRGITSLRNATKFNEQFLNYSPKLPPVESVTSLKDGDAVDLGGVELAIFETPGHTNCSLSIMDQETKMLFVGDSIGYRFAEDLFIPPIMPPEFSEQQLQTSITKVEALDFATICPAHFGCFTGDLARKYPDDARAAYAYWKAYFISRWQETPEVGHVTDSFRSQLAGHGLSETKIHGLADMFGGWIISGLKGAHLL